MAGIHYTILAHDFPQIYSLEKLMLDAKDQSQSAHLSWHLTKSIENRLN